MALARAVVWRFLSLGFAAPGPRLQHALTDDSARRALHTAVSLLELPPFRYGGSLDLDGPFEKLFGHTVRATVCPYETEYGDAQIFQQAQELADLRGWYAAFGLDRRPDVRERPDHIGVECEFAGFLSWKEAYVADSDDEEQLIEVHRAYRGFLRDHLGRFGMAVATGLEKADPGGFYGRLGGLCRALLTSECRRVEVRPGPRTLALRPDKPDHVPAACGAAQDCRPPGMESGPHETPWPTSARLLRIHGGESE